jgi:hypothetical protein
MVIVEVLRTIGERGSATGVPAFVVRRSPLAGRRSLVAGRRSPVAGRA